MHQELPKSLQKINFYTPVIDLLYDEFFSEESVMSSVNMQKKSY